MNRKMNRMNLQKHRNNRYKSTPCYHWHRFFGDDLTIQYICDVLDIDYEDVKDKLPDNEADKVQQVQDDLDSIIPDDEGGGIGEQSTEGSAASTA